MAGGPSEGIKRWRTKAGEGKHSRRPVRAKREGGSGQTVRCFGFQEDFWLSLWSVRAGAKFNWMSLELQGRTGAAVTVLPHRTGFSVPTEFSSHTLQAVDGRPGVNRADSFPCKSIKGHGCDPRSPTPDPPGLSKELKCCKRLCLIVPRWFPG